MTAAATVHDPICHMDIDMNAASGRSEFNGQAYYFCSMGCKRDFDSEPQASLGREAAYDHSQGVDHRMMGGEGASKRPWWQFWKK